MTNKVYEEMAVDFCIKHENPTIKDIYNLIESNAWKIYQEYERECHKEDLAIELEEQGLTADEDVFNYMLETFEDRLGDSEDWHYILNGVIDDFRIDLVEIKGDEE